jgi:hypothetical protein
MTISRAWEVRLRQAASVNVVGVRAWRVKGGIGLRRLRQVARLAASEVPAERCREQAEHDRRLEGW